MNEQGSIAKDTMAVCFATILLVALLLSAAALMHAAPQPEPVQTTASAGEAPGPFTF
jgi:hypothetical protein